MYLSVDEKYLLIIIFFNCLSRDLSNLPIAKINSAKLAFTGPANSRFNLENYL